MVFKGTHCGLLLLLILLVGCKTTSYYPLPDQIWEQMVSTDVYVLVPQKHINLEVKDSKLRRYSAGAISFAVLSIADSIIKKGRASKTRQFGRPLLDALTDVDFGHIYTAELERLLSHSSWLNVGKIMLVSELDDTTKQFLFNHSTADAVLFLDTSYQLSHDFSSLSASINSELLPKNEELKPYVRDPFSELGQNDRLHVSNHLYQEAVFLDLSIPGINKTQTHSLTNLTEHTLVFRQTLMTLALEAATITSEKLSVTPLLTLNE